MPSDTLQVLVRLWEQTGTGVQTALIEGEAGLGKSHLAQRFTAQALREHGVCVVVPPAPLIPGVLNSLYGYLKAEHHPAFLSLARSATPQLPWGKLAAPERPQHASLWSALYRLAVKERRLCLILEDVHDWPKDQWDQFQSLVRFLAERNAPTLLIVTSRPDDVVKQRWQRVQDWLSVNGHAAGDAIALHALSHDEVQRLVHAHLQTSEPLPELTGWLLGHARGHPLRTVLLLRQLRREGALLDLGVTWDFRPRDVHYADILEDQLQLELSALHDERDVEVLRLVAFAEEPPSQEHLSRVLPEEPSRLNARLARLAQLHVYEERPGAGYRLRYPLLKHVLQRGMTWDDQRHCAETLLSVTRGVSGRARLSRVCGHPQRSEWNRQALALAVERAQHADVAEFAEDLWRADTGNRELQRQLWQAWVDLSEYQRILDFGVTGDPACDIHLANALEVQGEYEKALEVLEAIDDDGRFHWKIVQRKLFCLDFLEDPQRLHEALRAYEGQEHAVLEWGWAEYYRSQSKLNERIRHLRRARDLLDEDSSALERAVMEGNLGSALIQTGTFDEAHACLTEAVKLFQQVGHAYGLLGCEINLAYLSLYRGDYASALRRNQRLYAVADRLQDTRLMSGVLVNTATCEVWMGTPERAVLNLQRSRELYNGYESARASDLAHAQALAGDLVSARDTLQDEDHVPLTEHLLYRARTHVLLGEHGAARRGLEHEALRSDWQASRKHLLLAWVHHLEGDQAGATLHLETARAALGELPHLPLQAELRLVHALIFEAPTSVVNAAIRELAALDAAGHVLLYRLTQPHAFLASPVRRPHSDMFIQTLGQFALIRNGQSIPWKGRKTRELLALLVTAHLSGRALDRNQLLLALWPDLPDHNAESTFRKNLQRLKQACGTALQVSRDHDGRYVVEHVHADVSFFLAALDASDLALAFEWYQGPYLTESSDESTAELRLVLQRRLRDALLSSASTRPPEQVLAWCTQYLQQDPWEVSVAQLAVEQARQVSLPYATRLRATLSSRFHQEWGYVPEELQGNA